MEHNVSPILLFDLDGTLTDPKEGITRSVEYALNAFGIQVASREDLTCFIGPPLAESFQVYFGLSKEASERAVQVYREYFSVTGLFENKVYPGIRQLLEEQCAMGRGLAVATSKPAVFARQILEHFGLLDFFQFLSGSELDGRRIDKGEVIRYCMEQMGIEDPGAVVMIGDRKHDVLGARSAGVRSVGVLYGYGSRAELEQAGAWRIVSCVEELASLLRSL